MTRSTQGKPSGKRNDLPLQRAAPSASAPPSSSIRNRAGWRNAKHRQQWENTLETYVLPTLGELPVSAIDTGLVVRVLDPIWTEKPETSGRVRGRIEAVLDAATVRGFRQGPNPAHWKGNLAHILPSRARMRKVAHHAALPFDNMPGFLAALRGRKGMAARALEFAALTAARTGAVLSARWGEIDWAAKVWTIPGERMKAGRDHRLPLSETAVAVLETLQVATEIARAALWSAPAAHGAKGRACSARRGRERL